MTDKERPIIDDFSGDNAKLIDSARALISLSDSGSIAPHGIGGHARAILSAFIVRTEAAALSQTAGVAAGWRVSKPDSGRAGDSWEVYAPDGSGGVVSSYDIKDLAVRDLLDALAAAPAASGGDRQADADLPGMWERADLIGGMTDAEPQPPSAASVSERARSSMKLLRFGRGNGLTPWILEPRIDGYWTPWHTAQSELDMAVESSTQLERALEQALTQQRVCATCGGRGEIGGHVGQTAETFDYVTEPCPECTTPQPSADAVRELVKRWRELSVKSHRDGQYQGYDTLRLCADELESLLSAASDHQQNAAKGGGEK